MLSERPGPAVTRTKSANLDGCRRISVYFWILGVKLYEKRAYLLRMQNVYEIPVRSDRRPPPISR